MSWLMLISNWFPFRFASVLSHKMSMIATSVLCDDFFYRSFASSMIKKGTESDVLFLEFYPKHWFSAILTFSYPNFVDYHQFSEFGTKIISNEVQLDNNFLLEYFLVALPLAILYGSTCSR